VVVVGIGFGGGTSMDGFSAKKLSGFNKKLACLKYKKIISFSVSL